MAICMGDTIRIIHIAIDNILLVAGVALPRSTCHAPDAPTMSAVARKAATAMWASRYGKEGLQMTCSQFVGTTRPLTISKPCDVCSQLLEARIQVVEIRVPTATMTVAKKCRPGPGLFPTEQHHAEKAGLEKEGSQDLIGEQRAGDAACEIREVAPVRSQDRQ